MRIACSPAAAQSFLPGEIARFVARYPRVRFVTAVRDHGGAIAALREYEADLALVFRPARHPISSPSCRSGSASWP